jgi:hypothetical protein
MSMLFPVTLSFLHEKPFRSDSNVASLGIEMIVYGTFLMQSLFVSLTTGMDAVGTAPAGQTGASRTSTAGTVGVRISVAIGLGGVADGSNVGTGVNVSTGVRFSVDGLPVAGTSN